MDNILIFDFVGVFQYLKHARMLSVKVIYCVEF